MNKSEEYIENESFIVVNPDYPVISKENALIAVKMAREEGVEFMKYKAMEAFKDTCPTRGALKDFVNELNS